MTGSRDDQNPVDAFAAENDLSIEDLPEDDPWTAFAAEQPAASRPEQHVTVATSWRPAVAGLAVAATVLIAAAGVYLFVQEPVDLNEQIAAFVDNPSAPREAAEADGPGAAETDAPRVPATEVIIPPAESASEPTPPVVANRRPVTPKRPARAAARQPTEPVPPPPARRSSVTDTNTAAQPESAPATNPAVAVANVTDEPAPLSGDWVMNTRVESSQVQRYEGLRLGYVLSLRQDGDRISGTGWKVREDDRTIRAASRTPINFDGVMNGDRVELTFTEGGRRRTTAGKLVLARDSDDVLRGRFSSSAAQSVGVVEIRR